MAVDPAIRGRSARSYTPLLRGQPIMHIAAVDDPVSPDAVLDQLRQRYPGLVQTTTWDERALLYDPEVAQLHGVYFVTVQERDGVYDIASALDARGAYRLSFAVTPERYQACFGALPTPGCLVDDARYDPRAIDTLMPHPVYAWMSWAAIVNPSAATFDRLGPLLDESYRLARIAHDDSARRGAQAQTRLP